LKILFLGSIVKMEDCSKYLGPSVAGNKMQIGIIKGLKKLHGDITVVTETPIATFPKERKMVIKHRKIDIGDGIEAIVVPFLNIIIIKQLTMIFSAFLQILMWSIKYRKEKKVVVTFNAFPYTSVPIILVSKLLKIKKICIFADPPINVIKKNRIRSIAKYFEKKATEKNIKRYDGIVTLNEKSIEKYASDIKYVLVDGGFDINDKPNSQFLSKWAKYSEGDLIEIVFSGGLYEYNGLVNLIKAFKKIKNESLRLSLYGEGPLKEAILLESRNDHRIIYHGNIDNKEMMLIQQKAGILINPRPIDEPVSLYTFPSKMIEYMLSGTPVITTKLNGLTPEYLKHVFVIENNSIEEIVNGIERVIKMDKQQLLAVASDAREFIVENKTWDLQSRKIYNFIRETM